MNRQGKAQLIAVLVSCALLLLALVMAYLRNGPA
jgi:hypothetical protein